MPEISLFANVGKVKNPINYDLIQHLEDIRDGKWEDLVMECRLISDKKERKDFKEKMPTATLSGSFSYRNDKSLEKHSGFISMDLDELENVNATKSILKKDRFVFACWVSTSGTGLRVLFRVDSKKHSEAFKGIQKYLHDEYDIIVDPNSSISKPYLVSFDPHLFMRMDIEDVPIFKKYPVETPIKKIQDFVHTNNDFERVVKDIVDKHVNIAEDYLDYIKVGLCIAAKYGESGRDNFHRVVQFGSTYKFKDADKQFNYFLRQTGHEKANIATFYYLAKINGIKITSETTKTIIRATKVGRKAGLRKEQIAENLRKNDNIPDALEIVGEVYDEEEDQDTNSEQSILFQLELFIQNNYSLKKNEVTGYIEQNGIPLKDADLNAVFIAAKKQIPVLDYQLMMRLLKSSDFIESYNPFYQFFVSDGIPVVLPAIPEKTPKHYDSPLIELLAKTIENDDPAYTLFFVRKWLVSIISAAHKVHSPLLLCLLGGQNTGKTEWFRRLLPKELQAYYAESKLDKEKDDEILMTENLIIMDDELGGKSKQDNIKLKNITSKQYFYLRRPYGDHNEKILRLAVLCGTSNIPQIMSDTTGNRRIIAIDVNNINKELYNSIDKKDLFLEAFRLYKEGFDWRVTSDDINYLNKDQEKYEMIVAERELIEKYFVPCENDKKLTTTDIKVEIEIMTKQKLNINTLGRELTRAGFTQKTSRDGKSTAKKWGVKRINRGSELLDYTPQPPAENKYDF